MGFKDWFRRRKKKKTPSKNYTPVREFAGPVQPGVSEKVFRDTGKSEKTFTPAPSSNSSNQSRSHGGGSSSSTNQFAGPVQPGVSEKTFRETGKSKKTFTPAPKPKRGVTPTREIRTYSIPQDQSVREVLARQTGSFELKPVKTKKEIQAATEKKRLTQFGFTKNRFSDIVKINENKKNNLFGVPNFLKTSNIPFLKKFGKSVKEGTATKQFAGYNLAGEAQYALVPKGYETLGSRQQQIEQFNLGVKAEVGAVQKRYKKSITAELEKDTNKFVSEISKDLQQNLNEGKLTEKQANKMLKENVKNYQKQILKTDKYKAFEEKAQSNLEKLSYKEGVKDLFKEKAPKSLKTKAAGVAGFLAEFHPVGAAASLAKQSKTDPLVYQGDLLKDISSGEFNNKKITSPLTFSTGLAAAGVPLAATGFSVGRSVSSVEQQIAKSQIEKALEKLSLTKFSKDFSKISLGVGPRGGDLVEVTLKRSVGGFKQDVKVVGEILKTEKGLKFLPQATGTAKTVGEVGFDLFSRKNPIARDTKVIQQQEFLIGAKGGAIRTGKKAISIGKSNGANLVKEFPSFNFLGKSTFEPVASLTTAFQTPKQTGKKAIKEFSKRTAASLTQGGEGIVNIGKLGEGVQLSESLYSTKSDTGFGLIKVVKKPKQLKSFGKKIISNKKTPFSKTFGDFDNLWDSNLVSEKPKITKSSISKSKLIVKQELDTGIPLTSTIEEGLSKTKPLKFRTLPRVRTTSILSSLTGGVVRGASRVKQSQKYSLAQKTKQKQLQKYSLAQRTRQNTQLKQQQKIQPIESLGFNFSPIGGIGNLGIRPPSGFKPFGWSDFGGGSSAKRKGYGFRKKEKFTPEQTGFGAILGIRRKGKKKKRYTGFEILR